MALDEVEDAKREAIQHNAIATKGSTAENIEDFLKLFDKRKVVEKESDHKANLALLNKKL